MLYYILEYTSLLHVVLQRNIRDSSRGKHVVPSERNSLGRAIPKVAGGIPLGKIILQGGAPQRCLLVYKPL